MNDSEPNMVLAQLPAIICIPEASSFVPETGQQLIEPDEERKKLFQAISTIFDLGHRAKTLIRGSIHPALMDLNASHHDAIKVKVSHGTGQQWLDDYYHPFHKELQLACDDPSMKIGFDCHIMNDASEHPPAIISLTNKGDRSGHQSLLGGGLSCPTVIFRDMLDITTALFSKYEHPISVNPDKHHGFIISHYAKPTLPWIRIGLSRSLLLGEMDRMFDHHVQLLQEHFQSVLTYLFKVEDWMKADE